MDVDCRSHAEKSRNSSKIIFVWKLYIKLQSIDMCSTSSRYKSVHGVVVSNNVLRLYPSLATVYYYVPVHQQIPVLTNSGLVRFEKVLILLEHYKL